MPLSDFTRFLQFRNSQEDILSNRKIGKIYCANFNDNSGKYISTTIVGEPVDVIVQISPKIELRFTYMFSDTEIKGLQITKLNSNKVMEKINLTTLDWGGILGILHVFNSIDAGSIASGSLILDKSIVSDADKLKKFLTTIASDPEGLKKFEEVAKNFSILQPGDVDQQVKRRESIQLMDNLLNNSDFFEEFKKTNGIGKPEEVWQRFFQSNSWLLGSEVVQILEERDVDEESIVDLPIESYDGFLDIVELKLPQAEFWTKDLIPQSDLTKAIMQCMRYVLEYERRMNDHKKIAELGVDIIKPRITLVYGRSNKWTEDQKKQFRILNSSFHNISILTFDHVFLRANRIVGERE